MNIDLKKLRSLLKTLKDGDVSEFEFENDKIRVKLSRGEPNGASHGPLLVTHASTPAPPPAAASSAAAPPAAESVDANTVIVTSPFVGTFYRAPTPDQPDYKSEGDDIEAGDVIGLIEVMKSFHEVKSDIAGKVVKFLVENEDAVTAGQSLADVED